MTDEARTDQPDDDEPSSGQLAVYPVSGGGQPGDGPPPGHGQPPGYGSPPGYGPPPAGYGPVTQAGPVVPPGYGPPPGYGAPVPPPGYGYGAPSGYAVPPPPGDAWRRPSRVEPVPGTSFAVGYLAVPSTISGTSIGSLVVGIASVLISLLVAIFGFVGAQDGWGAIVAGAFAVLASIVGLAGIGLGLVGLRQIRRADPGGGVRGRGLAIAGLICGGAGVAITVLVFAGVLLIQLS